MDLSERAHEFLRSLDPEGLKVGDGGDHLPVWIGVDADEGKVFKVYASGLATGFGDGRLSIRNGLQLAKWRVRRGDQITAGRQIVLSGESGFRVVEAEAVALKLPGDPLSHNGGTGNAMPVAS